MQERILGTRDGGLKVSAIGLGCMGITYGHGDAMDYASAEKLLQSAVEMGITLFDSAECYDGNEVVVGKALKPYRNQVAIVTKCGIRHDGSGGSVLDARPETIFSSIDQSLQKLGTDHVELYYLHRVDPKVSIEEVAGAMQSLIEQGKILHWGISEATADTIRRAHKVCPITAIESEYSMMWTNPEKELFPTLEELGIGFMPFSPLGKGFLTGTMNRDTTFAKDDARNTFPRFSSENLDANQALVELVKATAEEKNVTPAQIALAWILNKKPWIVPIPETTKIHRLSENIAAAGITLSESEMKRLDDALGKIEVVGDRYAKGSDDEKNIEQPSK